MNSAFTHLGRIPLCIALALCGAQIAGAGNKDIDKALMKLENKLKGDQDKNEAESSRLDAEDGSDASKETASSVLNQDEAGRGIREALADGVENAIAQLGQENGYLNDQVVRIVVPKKLRKLTDMAKSLGAGKYVDRFETSMNRAAEKAVPQAASILGDSIRTMSMQDAIALVRGGDTSATDYFRETSSDKLREAFLPIVKQSTESSGVTQNYKKLIDKAGGMGGLLSPEDIDLDRYVTERAMDGLFYYIAEQERAIRKNPVGQASDLLRRVFGKR